jgi:methionine-rich copper-binding protein CopC
MPLTISDGDFYFDSPSFGAVAAPFGLSSSSPADNATAVAVGSNIVLTFSENVAAGTGNIVISDGTDTRTIAVGDAQVSISGATVTINPTADLNPNSTYYVQMASGVITSSTSTPFAGISDTTTLNFTTGGVGCYCPDDQQCFIQYG